jgi:PST family polysaccharide transporter
MMLPLSQVRAPLSAVAIPALSHLQNDPIRYRKYYLKLIMLIAFITMPLMAFLFVCSDQVINLLLGNQWLGAVRVFRILCINGFIQPTAFTTGLVLMSLGQSKRYLVAGTLSSIFVASSFFLGIRWGAMGVATAYTIAIYVLLVPSLWYCFRRTPISIQDFFSATFRQAIAGIIAGLAMLAIRSTIPKMPDIVSMACSFVGGFLTYLILLLISPGGYSLLREFYAYRSLLRKILDRHNR